MTNSGNMKARHMSRLCLILVPALLWLPGCGPSRNDLLLRSAQRARDDDELDEEDEPAANAPAQMAEAAPSPSLAPSTSPSPATSPAPSAPAASTSLSPVPESVASVEPSSDASVTPAPAAMASTPVSDSVSSAAADVGATEVVEIATDVEPKITGVEIRSGEPILERGLVPIDERTPEEPLTETERRVRAAENLQKIAEALIAYARDKKRLPPTYRMTNGFKTLSWRVEILPYLGYKELYDKFDPSTPWNRPPNDELLKYIPDVYASPERFDMTTNMLMPAREGFIGGGKGGRALDERAIEDGVANTLLIIEANDKEAVPWTSPQDFSPESREDIPHRLFKVRDDGAFAVWANGWTVLLPAGTPPATIWNAMSIEGGDGLMAGKIHRDIPLENVSEASVAAEEVAETPEEPAAVMDPKPQGPTAVLATREPVPTSGQIAAVQSRFRQVFADRLKDLDKDSDRKELASEMLDRAAEMTGDPVGAYALQTAAMRLAIEAGGIGELIRGIDQRVVRFEVDAFEENMTWLLDFGYGVRERDVETIDGMDYAKRAIHVIYAAIYDDEYIKANSLARYSFRLIDQERDEDLPKNITKLKGLLGQAQRDFDEASKSLAAYRLDPNNGEAAADVGRFLCFIKGDWERGLPLLTEGGPEVLQDIASLDLKGASDSSNQVAIGDAWWDLSEKARTSVYRQAARDRAALWYKQAFEVMPDSLDRLHVKARLDEAEDAAATSPLAMVAVLAEDVGVDLSVSLAAVGKQGGSRGRRGGARGAVSRDEANEG
ncbi:MAG: DUF1559 domain-containing protein [Planctomycetota bacterium]